MEIREEAKLVGRGIRRLDPVKGAIAQHQNVVVAEEELPNGAELLVTVWVVRH